MTMPPAGPDLVLNNARIVLDDAVLDGSVLVRDGLICDIGAPSSLSSAVDLEGDHLIPGLVELHTDHLEGHYAPRAKVRWNPAAAVLAHDAQLASSGITTVFDALRVGLDEHSETTVTDMERLAGAIDDGMRLRRLRAEHFIHLRCEVSAPDCMANYERLAGRPRVRLVSLMDHAPGQRQFTDIDAYRAYHMARTNRTRAEFDAYCLHRAGESQRYSAPNRAALAGDCRARGIAMASHDDATAGHVAEAVANGVRIAEFPTTMAAAEAAGAAGLAVLMGAPNIVRGGSHSGNVPAGDLAAAGLLDILSSDYIPFSLVQAAFHLDRIVEGITLPRAVAMVAASPARAAGLDDRGTIAPGKRADLVRVRVDDDVPVVRSVWRQGERVA